MSVQVRSRSAQARSDQVRLGLGQVRSVQDRSSLFRSISFQGLIRLSQIKSVQGHVSSGQDPFKVKSRHGQFRLKSGQD